MPHGGSSRGAPAPAPRLFADASGPEGPLVRVVIERGIDHPDGLTYALPRDLRGLAVGDRVVVPLGARDAPANGVVTELDAPAPAPAVRVKAVRQRAGGRLPPGLVELARWMAGYHCCPLGVVLGTMLPAAVKKGVGAVTVEELEPTGAVPARRLPPTVRAAWEGLAEIKPGAFPMDAKALAARLGLANRGPVNRLVDLGVLRRTRRTVVRAPWAEHASGQDARREPTDAQRRAIDAIGGALGAYASFLLFGVTGSGKTEVYLRAIEATLARGEAAIVLVPEISLTPQTAGRFIGRFGAEAVAVLHSGLTASQRHQQWARVEAGRARVVIGARSAVFAPFPSRRDAPAGPDGGRSGAPPLGLIVVDEEHDASYKQEQAPRYHARNVAIKRAHADGCPVVLGSATPSLESWANAGAPEPGPGRPRSTLLELPDRVGGGRLPAVKVVDMAAERRARPGDPGRQHALGPTLERALETTLETGGQAILLLNRRGYASYVHCPSSGWVLNCAHCDVTMVFHRHELRAGVAGRIGASGGSVRCHHCLAEQRLPAACPESGKPLSLFGAGTQRLEEELARKFHGLVEGETMLRLDADTMRRAKDYFDALEKFRRGEARLLLGTQMIAKGLDFPNVRLIGVVNADTSLALPDFRAQERTFQLVAQVAGRAGRDAASSADARVVVQTLNPRDPAILAAAAHDYRSFATRELGLRRRAGLPPATRLARIVFRDRDHARATRAAAEAYEAARAVEGGPTVRRPAPCAISRIDDHHRIALDLIAPTPGPVQRALTALRNAGLVRADAKIAVDPDPVSLV